MNVYPKGLLISIEGQDGSGKTTLSLYLAKALSSELESSVHLCRAPGGTMMGEEYRMAIKDANYPEKFSNEAQCLFFAATTRHLIDKVVAPHMEEDHVVIMDRFVQSMIAYQGHGCELVSAWGWLLFSRMVRLACNHMAAHLTICLEIPREVSEERAHSTKDYFESLPPAIRRRISDGYDCAFHFENALALTGDYVLIDGQQSIEIVQRQALEAIRLTPAYRRLYSNQGGEIQPHAHA